MNWRSSFKFRSLGVAAAVLAAPLPFASATDWLQFRGPDFQGKAQTTALPKEWGPEKNVAWRIELPGKGPSGPIVVDGKVIVTSSGGDARQQDRAYVEAYSEATGERLWRRQFWSTGRPYSHPLSANAAPTPVSDGERVYAFFSSNDLYCLTLEGDLVWYRGLGYDHPKAANDVGMSSSPVIAGDVVVVQIENQGDSFVAGVDRLTGETRWRLARPAEANWGSPISFRTGDTDAVLVVSRVGALAVRADNGETLWSWEGAGSSISSSVLIGNRVLVPYNGLVLTDVSSAPPQDVWVNERMRPSNTSPIVDGDRIYMLSGNGVLAALDLATGERLWQLRMNGSFWSTPLIADGYLYAFSQAGVAQIVKLGAESGEVVAEYDLAETILASPAASDTGLYIRSDSALWKFATE